MTRREFDRQLRDLQDSLLFLGGMVEKAIHYSVDALGQRDVARARAVIHDDAEINRRRYQIEEQCMHLMAMQQPMARDLRAILGVLIIANEIERIGDYAVGIARITVMMADEPLLKPHADIPRMAEKGTDMLRRVLDAFIQLDADAARQIANDDDEVDALNDKIYLELLSIMINDPTTVRRATWLLWVTYNLERIADRVTNICERVVFMATGQVGELNVSTY